MHPITILRNYLAAHPELREFSSQRGIGKLIGKSDAYIRALENKPAGMSMKAANLIQQRTGVCAAWLMLPDAREAPILGSDGTPFTHAKLLDRIRREIADNHAAAAAVGWETVIDELLKMARAQLLDSLARNDTSLLSRFTQVLAEKGVLPSEGEADV